MRTLRNTTLLLAKSTSADCASKEMGCPAAACTAPKPREADRVRAIKARSLGACLSNPREPRWLGEGADARRAARVVVGLRPSRATPQTPLSQPTRRERADFPSFVVVASSLGLDPTTSAPPRLRGNLPRSRPRRILRQAPSSQPAAHAAQVA